MNRAVRPNAIYASGVEFNLRLLHGQPSRLGISLAAVADLWSESHQTSLSASCLPAGSSSKFTTRYDRGRPLEVEGATWNVVALQRYRNGIPIARVHRDAASIVDLDGLLLAAGDPPHPIEHVGSRNPICGVDPSVVPRAQQRTGEQLPTRKLLSREHVQLLELSGAGRGSSPPQPILHQTGR